MVTHKNVFGLAVAAIVCGAILANVPKRGMAEEARVRVAPAIYRSDDSKGPNVRLVQYPVNYGSGWGWSGGYSGYGGYMPYGGYGWSGYGGPGGYVSYPVYSRPMPYSGIPVYSAYPTYTGYPIYSASYPSYGVGYGYPVYGAGYPGSYGYTYGPAVSIGFW